ncbi:peptidoglycan editing factor PgeF [Thermomonospora cellulosilytica]|uniref:Purine nucleoside phosphorylase n=1 Tax=Thermomonospora cellulosilytica TaxID=1411118 RepID=A0A7W3N4Y6_9ACTN|nr:peptidoglycan editing factor PgeF [Thermomonospora cellulosilytica]MBA9007626.1 YfiH family protein [Thermomonospora cellulosilytica]
MRLAGRAQVAITDRSGGVSAPPFDERNLGGAVGDDPEAVRRNRELTARELGLDPSRVVYMRQVHSAEVRYVTGPFGDDPPGVDAIFTDRPGLGLAVLVADCAPVLVADPDAGLVGAAHSGRVGTAAGVVPALVAAMAERGADPARMTALIGPCACGLCYEVSAGIRDEVAALIPETRATTRRGTPALDVRAGVEAQLKRAGVADIRHDARCTLESPELYSYRRSNRTGRFAGYIWLT